MNEKLQAEIIEQTKTWYLLACDCYGLTPRELEIRFDLKGSVAGIGWSGRNLIQYNPILAEENEETFNKRTVPHEVAHIIANKLYGKNCGHGTGWKRVMTDFGLEASRCHSYDTTTSKLATGRRVYQYTCFCGKHNVGKNLHEKIQKGSGHYCPKCKAMLRNMTFVTL